MFRHYWISFIQTWYDDRYYCTLYFDISLIDVDLDSRSQECEIAPTSAPVISHKVFDQFECNLVHRLDSVVWWTSYSFYLVHSIFKGENPAYVILLKKLWHRLVFRHLQTFFFQKWCDDRDHWALHFDISLVDLDLHSVSQLFEKYKILVSISS